MNNGSGTQLPLGSRIEALDIGQGVVERLARWKVNTYNWGKIDADNRVLDALPTCDVLITAQSGEKVRQTTKEVSLAGQQRYKYFPIS